ncbi:hypothetical protein HYH02_005210 [Chlamydomonas schloesseri]|uniref:Uncharacterized protein n=1 Tax=Chlamydomonas schloesseri TaxID=2026947 RepID=A0A835WLM2_9CHLO|nr:hypothetical protein HYH02_005210 [Chlamydomonas schloesseri]|eukprot:KAG2449681.1 hypothetical protein HYH02_005210 [Chlamydomonas schloesseri]
MFTNVPDLTGMPSQRGPPGLQWTCAGSFHPISNRHWHAHHSGGDDDSAGDDSCPATPTGLSTQSSSASSTGSTSASTATMNARNGSSTGSSKGRVTSSMLSRISAEEPAVYQTRLSRYRIMSGSGDSGCGSGGGVSSTGSSDGGCIASRECCPPLASLDFPAGLTHAYGNSPPPAAAHCAASCICTGTSAARAAATDLAESCSGRGHEESNELAAQQVLMPWLSLTEAILAAASSSIKHCDSGSGVIGAAPHLDAAGSSSPAGAEVVQRRRRLGLQQLELELEYTLFETAARDSAAVAGLDAPSGASYSSIAAAAPTPHPPVPREFTATAAAAAAAAAEACSGDGCSASPCPPDSSSSSSSSTWQQLRHRVVWWLAAHAPTRPAVASEAAVMPARDTAAVPANAQVAPEDAPALRDATFMPPTPLLPAEKGASPQQQCKLRPEPTQPEPCCCAPGAEDEDAPRLAYAPCQPFADSQPSSDDDDNDLCRSSSLLPPIPASLYRNLQLGQYSYRNPLAEEAEGEAAAVRAEAAQMHDGHKLLAEAASTAKVALGSIAASTGAACSPPASCSSDSGSCVYANPLACELWDLDQQADVSYSNPLANEEAQGVDGEVGAKGAADVADTAPSGTGRHASDDAVDAPTMQLPPGVGEAAAFGVAPNVAHAAPAAGAANAIARPFGSGRGAATALQRRAEQQRLQLQRRRPWSRATRRTFLDPLDCYRVSAPAALLGYSAAAGEPAPLLPCSRVRYALAALEETAGVSVQQLRPAPRAVSACASGQASAFASAAAAGCVVRAPGPQVLGGLPAVPHLLPAASAPAAGGQRCTTGGLADGEVDSAGALRAMAPPPLRVLSARSELIMVAARSSSPHLEPGTVDRRSDGGSSAAAAGTDGSPTHMTPGSTSASTSSNGNTNRSDASVVVRSSSQLCGVPTVAAQDLLRCRDPCSAAAAVTAAAAAWQDSQRAAAAGVQYDDDAAAAAAFPTAYLTDALAVQPPVAAGADTPKAPVGDAHVPPMDACRATCYENPLAAAYGTIGPDVDCSYRNPLCRVNDTGGGDGGDGGGCGGGDEDEGTEDVIAMPVMPLNVLLTWSIAGGRGGSSRGGSGGGAPSGGGNGGGGVLGAACCTESVGSSCAGGSEKLVGGHAGSPMGGLVRTLHGPAGGGSQQQAAARK